MCIRAIVLLTQPCVNGPRSAGRLLCLAACLLLASCAGQQCTAGFDAQYRPSGYGWTSIRDARGANTGYYGHDPSNGWSVYVTEDGRYYAYAHTGTMRRSDQQSHWCPHNAGQPSLMSSAVWRGLLTISGIFSDRDRTVDYSYLHRPAGYHWKQGPNGFYGIDPTNGWTVYVGSDNQYYSFPHRGPIRPGDLSAVWDPHDAPKARELSGAMNRSE